MEAKTMKRSESLIDYAKLFFAFAVVLIHAGCFSGSSDTEWVVMHGLLRLAVPFFFCASGYFLYRQLTGKDIIEVRKKYIKRLIPPLVFWLALNLPLVVIQYARAGDSAINILLKIIRGLVFYPWGALWYVTALLVAILIITFFYKRKQLKMVLIIGLLLYLIGLVFNTYYFVVEGTALQGVVDKTLSVVGSMRNGLFEGLLFVCLGVYVAIIEKRKSVSIRRNIVLVLVGFFALLVEIMLTKNLAHRDDHSLFIAFLIVIPSLVLLLSRHKSVRNTVVWRNYSTGIYFSHRFVLALFMLLIPAMSDDSVFLFNITILTIALLLTILYSFNNKRINKYIT